MLPVEPWVSPPVEQRRPDPDDVLAHLCGHGRDPGVRRGSIVETILRFGLARQQIW
jgi:hypothetical protein